MLDENSSEEKLPLLLNIMELGTPNSKMSRSGRESRIRGLTRPRVLFPAQTQVHTQRESQAKIKWSELETSVLVAFVQQESGEKVTHKNMEYWNRTAAFVKQESKSVHCRTGKHFHYC